MAGDVNFEGQAIVVTGAGRGLGRAQALLLAARGAQVVVADNGSAMGGKGIDEAAAEAVAAAIRNAGGTAIACSADLADEAGAAAPVSACLDAFGRIDAIAHYASPCPPLTAPEDIADQDLERLLAVNPLAAIRMTRAAWPHMADQGYGRLLFASSAAIYGALGNVPYATAKSAYPGLVRCLALEGKPVGIGVNAILPAARTRMTEGFASGAYAEWFERTMTPEKVAFAGAYLLSAPCPITGEVFAVGGGRIARVAIAEAAGVFGAGESIEEVRDTMSAVMADRNFTFPKDLSERSTHVARLFGFDQELNTSSAYASTDTPEGNVGAMG